MRVDPSAIYNKYNKKLSSDKSTSVRSGGSMPKEGQIIKGTVLDASQSGVKIKLSDGQVLDAKLNGDFQFSIGDEVSFVVKESTGEQLLLTPELTSLDLAGEKLGNILLSANLPASEANTKMLKMMLANNLPVDSQSLNDMAKLIKQYPDASMKELVFMVKHDLPISGETIKQLNMLENNEHALMKGIASLAEDISHSSAMSKNESQVMSAITEDSNALNFIKTVSDSLKSLNANHNIEGKGEGQAQVSEVLQASSDGLNSQSVLVTNKEQKLLIDETLTKHVSQEVTSINSKEIENENTPIKELEVKELETKELPIKDMPIKAMVMSGDYEKLTRIVKTMTGLSVTANFSVSDLEHMAKDGLISQEQLRDFLSEIKEDSTYHTVAKGLLMTEGDLEDVSQLKSYFTKLHNKVTSLIDGESGLFDQDSNVSKEATNVKSSVEFMNALNQDFNLMHLPMMLGDQLLNSELYVMNDRKELKKDSDTITALVRLDLRNLGHTDIYVKKTSKNVDVTFYMEQEDQIDIVKEKVFKLHKMLRDKGFNTMGINVLPLTEAFNISEDFLKDKDTKEEMKRFSFDMRA